MAGELAVSDTGPIVHLFEVGQLKALRIVRRLLVPPEVGRELRRGRCAVELGHLDWVQERSLPGRAMDRAAGIARRWGLELGEAETIALSLELGVRLIFTDDLEARAAAKGYGLEPHGSVGILLRAFREDILATEEVIGALGGLHSKSSLYITSDLVKRAVEAVKGEVGGFADREDALGCGDS